MPRKDVKVSKAGGIRPDHQLIKNGDDVFWTIDTLGPTESLVVESPLPQIVPTTAGAPGSKTIDVPVSWPTGHSHLDVPYTIYIDNGSRTEVGGGFLVIDTSGPPTTGDGSGKPPQSGGPNPA